MSSKLTQTELGEEFGISSIAMGKKLIELNQIIHNILLKCENV